MGADQDIRDSLSAVRPALPGAQNFSHYPAIPPPVDVKMVTSPEPCPYLPPRQAEMRGFYASRVPGDLYHDFMDAGFRRSGKVVYQPVCQGCRACVPIRMDVAKFSASKSQRRCRRRNGDVDVTIDRPVATDEKWELYRRYSLEWHNRTVEDRESFESFLYDSPVETMEFTHRHRATGRLLGVGICDLSSRSLSSVYFYFDPAESRRGLGTFAVLVEIDIARRLNVPFYYLGYWVSGCSAMAYKSAFGPYELLHPDGVWRPPGPAGIS